MELTKTEFKVSALLASGFEVKEIARKLFRSYHTIAFHVKRIRLKNGLKNIAEITREFVLAHGDPRQYIKTLLLLIQLSVSVFSNDITLINSKRVRSKRINKVRIARKYND